MKNQPIKLPDIFADNPELAVIELDGSKTIICDTDARQLILSSHENDFIEISKNAIANIAVVDGKSTIYIKDAAKVCIHVKYYAEALIVLSNKCEVNIVGLLGSGITIQSYDQAQVNLELYGCAKVEAACKGSSVLTATLQSTGKSEFFAEADAAVNLKIASGKHYLTSFSKKKVQVELNSKLKSELFVYIYEDAEFMAKLAGKGYLNLCANHMTKSNLEIDVTAKAKISAAHQSVVTIGAPVPKNIETVLINDTAVVKVNFEEKVST